MVSLALAALVLGDPAVVGTVPSRTPRSGVLRSGVARLGAGNAQAQLLWLPDAPRPRLGSRSRAQRPLLVRRRQRHRAERETRVASIAKGAGDAARALSPAPKSPTSKSPNSKSPAAKPLPRREQIVALRFQDPRSRPVRRVGVTVEILGPGGRVLDRVRGTTGAEGREEGVLRLTVKSFPCVLRMAIEDEEWAISQESQGFLALRGTEGSRVARLERPAAPTLAGIDPTGLFVATGEFALGQGKRPAAPVREQVLRFAYEPPSVTLRREVADVAFQGTPDTEVLVGGESLGKIDASGTLRLTLPLWSLKENDLLYRREGEGAIFAGYGSAPELDPYAPTAVTAPPMALVAVKNVEIARVELPQEGLMSGALARRLYGAPIYQDARGKRTSKPVLRNGAATWTYPALGLTLGVRSVAGTGQKDVEVVERLRLVGPGAGSVAGLQVGQPASEVRARLGDGDATGLPGTSLPGTNLPGTASGGESASYLGGGLAFGEAAGRIAWIELRRPIATLKAGIDPPATFTPTRLFLAPLVGKTSEFPGAEAQIRAWIGALPGTTLVEDRASADRILEVALDEFDEDRSEVVGLVPYKVESRIALRYRLIDAADEAIPSAWDDPAAERSAEATTRSATGSARADYNREVRDGAILFGILTGASTLVRDTTARRLLEIGIGVSVVSATENMRKTMQRAAGRTRMYALKRAVEPIVADLNAAASYRTEVVEIDRKEGTLLLRAGEREGVRSGMLFALTNGRLDAFATDDDPLRRDLYAARVLRADAGGSLCRLVRIERRVSRQMRETKKEAAAKKELDRVLDPTTGIVVARLLLAEPTMIEGEAPDEASGGG